MLAFCCWFLGRHLLLLWLALAHLLAAREAVVLHLGGLVNLVRAIVLFILWLIRVFLRQHHSDSFLISVFTMSDLTMRMVPLAAFVALNPFETVNLTVISVTEVHLIAVITLLILLEAFVAVFTEADLVFCCFLIWLAVLSKERHLKPHLGELGLLVGKQGRLLFADIQVLCVLVDLGTCIVRAAVPVRAELQLYFTNGDNLG